MQDLHFQMSQAVTPPHKLTCDILYISMYTTINMFSQ